jgi:hypothetical protein
MDNPGIEAVAESEYDTWWDDGFVDSDATQQAFHPHHIPTIAVAKAKRRRDVSGRGLSEMIKGYAQVGECVRIDHGHTKLDACSAHGHTCGCCM